MCESPTAAEVEINALAFLAVACCVGDEEATVSIISGDTFYVILSMPSTFDSQLMETGQIPVVMSSPRMNTYKVRVSEKVLD